MPKKIIQDIRPPERRSIRNIPINRESSPGPGSKSSIQPTPLKNEPRVELPPRKAPSLIKNQELPELESLDTEVEGGVLKIPTVSRSSYMPSRFMKVGIIAALIVAVCLCYLAYLFLHISATVTIKPKVGIAAINGNFVAKKDATTPDLKFEVITVEKEGTRTVPATGEKQSNLLSSGKVTIYNNFSKATQRLIKNTRLESSDGHVYRLDESVVVPGLSTGSDGQPVPGSITVSVHADAAGSDYNIGLTDFTIPGFKGDPRYSKFYGRSKTAMTGGFSGIVKTASSADINAARTELSASLKAEVINQAKGQVPSGYILYDNALYIDLTPIPSEQQNVVNMKASLHGIVFSKDQLAAFIARKSIPQYTNDPITSTDLDSLTFKPNSLEVAPWTSGSLPFSLSGTTTLTWLVNTDRIAVDLAGVEKSKVNDVFKKFSGIDKAEVEVAPAWKSSLPTDSSKIEVILRPDQDKK